MLGEKKNQIKSAKNQENKNKEQKFIGPNVLKTLEWRECIYLFIFDLKRKQTSVPDTIPSIRWQKRNGLEETPLTKLLKK